MTTMTQNTVHKLPGGYQWIVNPRGDHSFDDCFECGNAIDAGKKVYFTGEDDGCPLCSLACAKLRREQLDDCKKAEETQGTKGKPLNQDIVRLVEGLAHEMAVRGRKLELRARIEQAENDARVVFSGGLYGEASIWLSVSNEARIIAHWDGYLTAQAPQGAQYWHCIFSHNGREVGVRAWSYVGCGEAVAIARGELAPKWEKDAVLVSCKPCQFN